MLKIAISNAEEIAIILSILYLKLISKSSLKPVNSMDEFREL